jgi:hypothetical protein
LAIAPARKSQPSGLPGLRQATTKPTAPKAAENQTGAAPPLEFRLWRARLARGTLAAINTSTTPPSTAAVTGDASRKRRAVTSTVCDACALAGGGFTTNPTLRRDRSGNVTARPALVRRLHQPIG